MQLDHFSHLARILDPEDRVCVQDRADGVEALLRAQTATCDVMAVEHLFRQEIEDGLI